jgi:rhodanese-related sulfurtransferase
MTGSAVEAFLAAAREDLDRLTPSEVAELRDGEADGHDVAPLLLIDIRPLANRAAEGEIPGAVPVERIHLEWRLAPDSPWRIPQLTSGSRVVVFCNEGYASSLAARDLQRLGLARATDLVGGFRAWSAAGLPVVPGGSPAVP